MTSREYLEMYLNSEKEIKKLQEELDRYADMVGDIKSPRFSERIDCTKSTEPPFIRALEEIDEITSKLQKKLIWIVNLKSMIIKDIYSIKEKNLVDVLAMTYLDGLSADDVSKLLFIDRSTVYRWINKGLDLIKPPLIDCF